MKTLPWQIRAFLKMQYHGKTRTIIYQSKMHPVLKRNFEVFSVSGALPPARRVLGGVAGVLILAEATVGLLMLTQGFNGLLGGMYVAAAAGIWALLVVTTVLAALPSGSSTR